MEKEFVPYELAVKLKELGFDENCLTSYCLHWKDMQPYLWKLNQPDYAEYWDLNSKIPAPLWQQIFDWFRDQYSLHTEIRSYTTKRFTFVIQELKNTVKYIEYGGIHNTSKTYQEARQACLEKLIRIVEDKN